MEGKRRRRRLQLGKLSASADWISPGRDLTQNSVRTIAKQGSNNRRLAVMLAAVGILSNRAAVEVEGPSQFLGELHQHS